MLEFGDRSNGIIGHLISTIIRLHKINTNPLDFWAKYLSIHTVFGLVYSSLLFFDIDAMMGLISLGATIGMHLYYSFFMYPFIKQSFRKTSPLLIIDDINKLEHIGKLSELVRFLALLEMQACNIILISSDEETWAKLRK